MSKENKILIIIVAVAFASRLLPSLILSYPIENDALQYNDIARNLAYDFSYSRDGVTPTIERPPGYPFFLAIIYLLFSYHSQIAIFIQILISVLAVYLSFLLAKIVLKNEWLSLSVAGLAAIYPMFIYYNLFLYSENLAVLSAILFVYFLFKAFESQKKYFLAASGLFFAAFMLAKPLFALIIFLVLVFLFICRANVKLGHSLILFLLPVFILWGAWILRNYEVYSKPLPFGIGLGPIIFVGSNPDYHAVWPGYPEIERAVPAGNLSPIEYDNLLKQKAMERIKESPLVFVKLFFLKMEKFLVAVQDISNSIIYKRGAALSSAVFFPIVFVFYKFYKILISLFFLLGAVLAFKNFKSDNNYYLVFLVSLALYGLFAHSLLYVDERYHLPTFIFHLIIAIYGFKLLVWDNLVRKVKLSK